jgi:hypothetical protein
LIFLLLATGSLRGMKELMIYDKFELLKEEPWGTNIR